MLFLFILFASTSSFPRETDAAKVANNTVLMVCYSNYIRSPIAAAVFNDLARKRGLDTQWYCDSAGISVHSEFDMDKRAKTTLLDHGIEPDNTPREVTDEDFFEFDYIFGTDKVNMEALHDKKPRGSRAKLELLTTYDPEGSRTMRDPYFDDDSVGFEKCYQIAYRCCNAFLDGFVESER